MINHLPVCEGYVLVQVHPVTPYLSVHTRGDADNCRHNYRIQTEYRIGLLPSRPYFWYLCTWTVACSALTNRRYDWPSRYITVSSLYPALLSDRSVCAISTLYGARSKPGLGRHSYLYMRKHGCIWTRCLDWLSTGYERTRSIEQRAVYPQRPGLTQRAVDCSSGFRENRRQW